jgi:hypothetical protein
MVPQCADSSTAVYTTLQHSTASSTAAYDTAPQVRSVPQHRIAWHPVASRGIPSIPADPVASRGIPWHPVASRGIPWHPAASRGIPWRPVASHGIPRCPGGFALICLTCYKLVLSLHSLLWMAWLRHLPCACYRVLWSLHRDEDLEGSSRGRAVPLAVVSVYAKEQRAHARDASIRMDTRTR